MFEDIQKHRQAVRENIEKSLQIGFTESEDFEKAHQVGDIHPNGKWVWTQLPSGKFDWRVRKVQPQANTGGGSGIMGKTAPKSAVQNNPALSAKMQGIQQQMATQSQKNKLNMGDIPIGHHTVVLNGKTYGVERKKGSPVDYFIIRESPSGKQITGRPKLMGGIINELLSQLESQKTTPKS